jgi:copper(I)-binding protein
MNSLPRTLSVPALIGTCLLVVALAAGCTQQDGASAAADPSISVEQATIDWPANPSVAAVRMVVHNRSGSPDALIEVSTPTAPRAGVHRSETDDEGRSTMVETSELPIAAESSVTFGPAGLHVMLTGITDDIQVGDEVDLVLRFERMGTVAVTAIVIEPGTAPIDGQEGQEDLHEH